MTWRSRASSACLARIATTTKTTPWKENEFVHLLFRGRVVGGAEELSSETLQIAWFAEDELPDFSDGHEFRVRLGFAAAKNSTPTPHFE